ncbi:helix-turn-helix domain-containing protein [Selenomonas montiformis]|uniref:helix-turn-helix domain-containing protein n=1 Tax=Selenomonas montiformis TaxID=2652285 RepID=UPI003F893B60
MIGDTLRAEREKQNLTIKDIEKGTSIRSLYIDCIEKGEYQQLPGEVYTKGFIRNYANFLKLDADAAVKQYMDENHPATAVAAEPEENSTMREEPTKKKAAAFSTGNDFRQRVETSHKRQNKLLLVLIALIVAGGAVYLFASEGGSGVSDKKPAQTAAQSSGASSSASAKPVPEKKNDGVEVTAVFTDRCWTEVKADGKTVFEGTVEKGKTESWKGREKVVITAGNAGAVELKLNGKELGKAGKTGQVVEKTYTPDGEVSADQGRKDSKKS